MKMIDRSTARAVERGIISPEACESAKAKMTGSTDIQVLSTVDLAIESVSEDPALKANVLADFDRVCASNAIYAFTT